MNGINFNCNSVFQNDFINVLDFGMNENTPDCSKIFLEILDVAVRCKKTVYLPSGSYYFANPVQMFRSNLHIVGENKNNTFLIYSGPEIPDAPSGTNAAPVSPFFINGYLQESSGHGFHISNITFISENKVPSTLVIQGTVWSTYRNIGIYPKSANKYACWMGSCEQDIFEEFGITMNLMPDLNKDIEYGIYITTGWRASGVGAPKPTFNTYNLLRTEGVQDGLIVRYSDGCTFNHIAAEYNYNRNIVVTSDVRWCVFNNLDSESIGDTIEQYGANLGGVSNTYNCCSVTDGAIVGGNLCSYSNSMFNSITIDGGNNVFKNCIFRYRHGTINYSIRNHPEVIFENVYDNTDNKLYTPYDRRPLVWSDDLFTNTLCTPIVVYGGSDFSTDGKYVYISSDGHTSQIQIFSSPFVMPSGSVLKTTDSSKVLSWSPLNFL